MKEKKQTGNVGEIRDDVKGEDLSVTDFLNDFLDDIVEAEASGNVEGEINSILSKVGNYIDADKTFMFELDGDRFINRYEWNAQPSGVEDRVEVIPVEVFSDLWEIMMERRVLEIDFDSGKDNYRIMKFLNGKEIHRLTIIPLNSQGNLSGFLGAKDYEELGDLSVISLFSLLARHIETVISNKRMYLENMLNAARLRRFSDALLNDKLMVFTFNVSKDMIIDDVLIKSAMGDVSLLNILGLTANCSYNEFVSRSKRGLMKKYEHSFDEVDTCEKLLEMYKKGERSVNIDYGMEYGNRTCVIARQTYVFSQDIESDDIICTCFTKDITKEIQRQEKDSLYVTALSKEYFLVFYVNLDTGVFEVRNISYEEKNKMHYINYTNWYELCRDFISNNVEEGYREMSLSLMTRDKLLAHFENNSTLTVRFKIREMIAGRQHFEIHFVRDEDSDSKSVVVGFRSVDEAVNREEQNRRNLEEAYSRLRQQMQVTASLSDIYFATYLVDVAENSYEAIKQPDDISKLIPHKGEADDAIHTVVELMVDDDFKEEFYRFSDIYTISERIENRNYISYDYLSRDFGWCRGNIIVVSRDEYGQIKKFLFTVQIIDEEKRKELKTQNALKEAFEAANHANDAKTDFLSKMSHDIRTPMNAIIGMTAIAQANIDDKDRVKDALNKITSSGKHLLALINEILDMSRIESGNIRLLSEPINLPTLINTLLILVRPDAQKHSHTLKVYVNKLENEDVIGDNVRLQQVLVNIVGNAIKYTPNGGEIRLSFTQKPNTNSRFGCYEFVCEDTGIGMSKEFIEHIFEPFSRDENVRINKVNGTGLGMAITKNIVQLMNGDIAIESEVNEGTRITVTFYFEKQITETEEICELKGKRILVAGSDLGEITSAAEILEEFGVIVDKATSIEAAKEMISSASDYYSLLICGETTENTPAMWARELNRTMEKRPEIIVLADFDWTNHEAEARCYGVDRFVNKPIFKSNLLDVYVSSSSADSSEPEIINNSARFDSRRILLVEDNDINRIIAKELVNSTGAMVEEAQNGKEAVDVFAESEEGYFDMILMDVQMPVLNGYEATSAIRALPRKDSAHIPIIALTANAFESDVQMAKRVGMNDHLAKPIDIKLFMKTLERYLG